MLRWHIQVGHPCRSEDERVKDAPVVVFLSLSVSDGSFQNYKSTYAGNVLTIALMR